MADVLSEGVAACREGRIVWANTRLAEIVNRPVEALAGLAPDGLFEDGKPLQEGEAERALAEPAGHATVAVRFAGHSEDGTGLWLFEDRTRLRRLEAEVMETNRALHEVRLEQERLREQARRESEELDEVLEVVAHELRTPVTVLGGYHRLLLSERAGSVNAEQREFLEESLRSCQRMSGFIRTLIQSARDGSGDAALEAREGPLDATIDAVLVGLRPLLDDKQISLRVDFGAAGAEATRARFDPLRIEQVLANLVENAARFVSEHGRVELSLREVELGGRPFVEISVADDGPGVTPADRERIFERYVRGQDQRRGSLGLGLAICKRLVEAHGGVIGVTEREGGGSRFWFTLPAASGRPARPGSDPAEARGDKEICT